MIQTDIIKMVEEKQSNISDEVLYAVVLKASEVTPNLSVIIVLPEEREITLLLNRIYELVKDSEYTVTKVESYEKNRISFKNGSYIRLVVDSEYNENN